MNLISKKISDIANAILASDSRENIGLLSGGMGEALFLFHYDRVFDSISSYNRSIEIIENVFDSINNGNLFHTYCTGLAGVGWGIEYLIDNNFIDSQVSESLIEIDDLIGEMMIIDLKNGNYDFLHGASGSILYLLKRRNSNPEKIDGYIRKYLDLLENAAIVVNDSEIKWASIIDSSKGEMGYNISLSHGMTSIIAILSKIYLNGIEPIRSMQLAEKSANYLFNQRIDSLQPVSFFPSYSIESDSVITHSRLSWCYGDLGISIALWQSGMNFNKVDWIEFAEMVALKSTFRKKEKTGIIDAGICHGACGLSLMYNRLFINTKNKLFFDSTEYWLNETMNMAKFENGLAGYKTFSPSAQNKWVDETNLLTGISGIGLTLLSYISDTDTKWDELLLLS